MRADETLREVVSVPIRLSDHRPDPEQALMHLTRVASISAIGTRPAMAATFVHADDEPSFRLFEALFGRDSLIIARLLAPRWPALQPATLVALAAQQGLAVTSAPQPESYARRIEAPGRILHEVRDPARDPIGRRLVEEEGWAFPYFHSDDATPLFVRDLAQAAAKQPRLLQRAIVQRDGALRTLGDALGSALGHVMASLSSAAFIESHRPARIDQPGLPAYPVWQDSPDAYARPDGSLTEGPVAALEVQSQTIDALLACARLVARIPELAPRLGPEAVLRGLARDVAVATLTHHWDEQFQCFAAGVERIDGRLARTGGLKSAAGSVLDSTLLIAAEHAPLVRHLVEMLFDPAQGLVTPWGLRTLSAIHDCERYRPGAYHNGSIWLHDNHLVSLGLRRQGFHGLARWLEVRTVAICEQLRCYPEFIRGDSWESPLMTQHTVDVAVQDSFVGSFVNRTEQPPQLVQGWALAAFVNAERNMGRLPGAAIDRPVRAVEMRVLDKLRAFDVLVSRATTHPEPHQVLSQR